MGIRCQDRVVILLENSVASVIALYGILKAGGVFVMLNPGMKSGKLSFILKDCGAKAIISHYSKVPLLQEAATDALDLKHVIWCGDFPDEVFAPDKPREDFTTSCSLHSLTNADDRVVTLPRIIDVDLATIIYRIHRRAERGCLGTL